MNIDTPRTEAISACLDNDYKFEALKRIVQLERELNEARAAHKEASEYAQCAYCQTRTPKNPLHVLEHMEVCEKHPVRKAFAERDAWRKVADDLAKACKEFPSAVGNADGEHWIPVKMWEEYAELNNAALAVYEKLKAQ